MVDAHVVAEGAGVLGLRFAARREIHEPVDLLDVPLDVPVVRVAVVLGGRIDRLADKLHPRADLPRELSLYVVLLELPVRELDEIVEEGLLVPPGDRPVLAVGEGGLARDVEGEVPDERRPAEPEAEPVVVRVGLVLPAEIVGHEPDLPLEGPPSLAGRHVDDGRLRIPVFGVHTAGDDLGVVGAEHADRDRPAAERIVDGHAVDLELDLAGPAAPDVELVTRLDDTALERDRLGDVVDGELLELVLRDRVRHLALVDFHLRLDRLDDDLLRLPDDRLLERETQIGGLARVDVDLLDLHRLVAHHHRLDGVGADRHADDGEGPVGERHAAHRRPDDDDVRVG